MWISYELIFHLDCFILQNRFLLLKMSSLLKIVIHFDIHNRVHLYPLLSSNIVRLSFTL